ncbi:MAG: hypothetical protein HRU17_09405 [Polyangiaceae bacterium]|nr:hypothetical protein [Polyangiaceae bacterium]
MSPTDDNSSQSTDSPRSKRPYAAASIRKRRRNREREPEPTPIIGGRLWLPIGMFIAMAFFANPQTGRSFFAKNAPQPYRHQTQAWKVGATSEVRVSVVSADVRALACASDMNAEGVRCAYKADKTAVPRAPDSPLDDNQHLVIQPFKTVPDDHLVLIAGLWHDVSVAYRVHQEPNLGKGSRRLMRFVARCQVRFVAQASPDTVQTRWGLTSSWGKINKKPMVGIVQSCEVEAPTLGDEE